MYSQPLELPRRRFIQAGAVAGGLMLAGPRLAAQAAPDAGPRAAMKQGTLLTGGSQVNVQSGEKRWVFSQINLDSFIARFPSGPRDPKAMLEYAVANARLNTEINFLAHGVIPNPNNPAQVLIFEKKGDGGCLFDLKQNAVVTRIPPSKGGEFYGHGGYSTDGKLVYATEYDAKTYVGRMVVRDAADFKIVGEFPTHGEWPHDCQFIESGRVVAITNGGGHLEGGAKPNVAYVEVESGKLIEKLEFDNANINAGHLFITPGGSLAVLHAMREGLNTTEALGGLSLRNPGQKLATMADPPEITGAMKGETLSVAWQASEDVVAVTNPYGNLVSFWSVKERRYVSRIRLRMPRGVALTLDGKYFAITFDKDNPNVVLVPSDTRMPQAGGLQFPLACDGSHAYIYDYAV